MARLVRRVRGLETQVAAHESVVSSTVNGVFDALELSVNAQAGDVDRLRRVTLETARRSEEANENAGARLEALAQRVEGRIAPAELTLKYLEPLVQRLAKAVDARGRGNVVAAAAPAPKPEDLDAFYADFEDRFRGSRQLIKERQRVYLPYLVDLPEPRTAIDVGSGRGEWLELLRDAGWKATGFDTNLVFATRNRERGLDVQLGDGLALLRELGDGDVSLVTVFHLIEHLPFEDWLSMLDECRRVLRPGGMLILETPNPENLHGRCIAFLRGPDASQSNSPGAGRVRRESARLRGRRGAAIARRGCPEPGRAHRRFPERALLRPARLRHSRPQALIASHERSNLDPPGALIR